MNGAVKGMRRKGEAEGLNSVKDIKSSLIVPDFFGASASLLTSSN